MENFARARRKSEGFCRLFLSLSPDKPLRNNPRPRAASFDRELKGPAPGRAGRSTSIHGTIGKRSIIATSQDTCAHQRLWGCCGRVLHRYLLQEAGRVRRPARICNLISVRCSHPILSRSRFRAHEALPNVVPNKSWIAFGRAAVATGTRQPEAHDIAALKLADSLGAE